MSEEIVQIYNILLAGLMRAIPIMLASFGEMLGEKSGVMNLGVEGIMLMGAVTGTGLAQITDSIVIGVIGGVTIGAIFGLIHAFVTVTLCADQVVSGLAIVFLGSGLSSIIGAPLVSVASSPPFLEPIFLDQTIFTYFAIIIGLMTHFYMNNTRLGLELTSVGEDPSTAYAMGISVKRVRYIYVTVGASLMGLAGSSLSLAVTPGWTDRMSAGQGWIAIALVIFSRWKPIYIMLGAFMFGVVRRLPLDLQGKFYDPNMGYFLNMLPYLTTIIALSISCAKGKTGEPESLGKGFSER